MRTFYASFRSDIGKDSFEVDFIGDEIQISHQANRIIIKNPWTSRTSPESIDEVTRRHWKPRINDVKRILQKHVVRKNGSIVLVM